MIDRGKETLITVADAAALFPPRGKSPTHVTTVRRWMNKGYNGVRLEFVQIGGTLFTSNEAVERFISRTTAAKTVKESSPENFGEEGFPILRGYLYFEPFPPSSADPGGLKITVRCPFCTGNHSEHHHEWWTGGSANDWDEAIDPDRLLHHDAHCIGYGRGIHRVEPPTRESGYMVAVDPEKHAENFIALQAYLDEYDQWVESRKPTTATKAGDDKP